MRVAILSLGLLAAVGPAAADEEAIKIEDLPKPVRAAVEAKFPKAELVEASMEDERGKVVYEVALKDGGVAVDVSVSAKGRILEVERAVAPGKLPKAVAAAVKAEHPKAEIKKAEEVVSYDEGDDDGDKYFEVELSLEDGGTVELKISPKGKILDDDEADGDHEGAGDEKDDD